MSREQTLLNRLRRQLAHYEGLPATDPTKYERERDYRRAVTIRARVISVLRRQIKTIEQGRPLSEWPDTLI
jgi:hypothetical protein